MSVPICSLPSILSKRARSTLRILPRRGKHRLELAIAALLGGAAGRIALDEEDLGLGRVALLAVGELAGQAGDVERALAPGQLAGLARRLARLRRLDHLADDDARLLRMLLEPLRQQLADEALDDGPHFRGHELVLGLRGEFRVGAFDAQNAGQALAAVVAGQVDLLPLHQPRAFRVADDLAGERAAQADQMRAAVALRNVVGERQHVLVIAVVPPQRGLDDDAVALALDQHRLVDERRLGAVEIAHERFQAAFVVKLLAPGLGVARVGQHDAHAGIEEGEFAQAMLDRREIELDHGEGLGRRRERDLGSALRPAVDHRRRTHDLQRRDRVAVGETDDVLQPVAPDAQDERRRQGVDDRDADAVQAAGNLVGVLIELPAGVELGHDDLGRRDPLLLVNTGRNAAPVVGDGAGAVGVEGHRHEFRVAGQRFVDGVVDDLVDHVVKAGAVVGVADIHARPLAHRLEPTQHLDRIRPVAVGGILRRVSQILGHLVQNRHLFQRLSGPRFALQNIIARARVGCTPLRPPSQGYRASRPALLRRLFSLLYLGCAGAIFKRRPCAPPPIPPAPRFATAAGRLKRCRA